MKRVAVGLMLVIGGAAGSARAEEVVTRGYKPVDLGPTSSAFAPAAVTSHVLFLNNCKTASCSVSPGTSDSRSNRSTVADFPGTLAAFPLSDSVWNQVVECVRQTYAPFNIQIVTTEPPKTSSYFEAMVGGVCTDIMNSDPNFCSSGSVGIAPWSCGNVINNAISFTFAGKSYYQSDSVNRLCWTIAQESAHAFGLDHEYLRADPMTYLDGSEPKRFQDIDASCGTGSAAPCACGGSTQNSVALLRSILGSSSPTPPKVTITDPKNGAQVQGGFPVHADLVDTDGISKVELYVDGKLGQSLSAPPFAFNAAADLGQGTHHVEVRAYDSLDTPGSGFIDVVIGAPCTSQTSCGDGKACVDGRCVTGPGQPGGLGEVCTKPADCKSGICGDDGTTMRCAEACDPTVHGCPTGFACNPTSTTNANQGVCWPGGADDGGTSAGCSADGGNGGAAPIGVGLAFAAFAIRRRRRR